MKKWEIPYLSNLVLKDTQGIEPIIIYGMSTRDVTVLPLEGWKCPCCNTTSDDEYPFENHEQLTTDFQKHLNECPNYDPALGCTIS